MLLRPEQAFAVGRGKTVLVVKVGLIIMNMLLTSLKGSALLTYLSLNFYFSWSRRSPSGASSASSHGVVIAAVAVHLGADHGDHVGLADDGVELLSRGHNGVVHHEDGVGSVAVGGSFVVDQGLRRVLDHDE